MMSIPFGGKLLLAGVAIGHMAGPQGRAQQQAAAAPLEFEVASVKPAKGSNAARVVNLAINHGRANIAASPLRRIIAQAYDVQTVRVLGGPGWLDTDLYDIVAKTDKADASKDEVQAMMQALLADRFKLALHRETKELPVYEVAVAKNGPKLPVASDEEKQFFESGRGRVILQKFSMTGFVNFLANSLGSPVLNKTGLTGIYDFKLEWTDPRFQRAGGVGAPQMMDSGLSLFGAMQEQLGLKMEVKKGPVAVLVVDHVEKPSEN
jgi:uncharacterized protein (TIGR03435 family)